MALLLIYYYYYFRSLLAGFSVRAPLICRAPAFPAAGAHTHNSLCPWSDCPAISYAGPPFSARIYKKIPIKAMILSFNSRQSHHLLPLLPLANPTLYASLLLSHPRQSETYRTTPNSPSIRLRSPNQKVGPPSIYNNMCKEEWYAVLFRLSSGLPDTPRSLTSHGNQYRGCGVHTCSLFCCIRKKAVFLTSASPISCFFFVLTALRSALLDRE